MREAKGLMRPRGHAAQFGLADPIRTWHDVGGPRSVAVRKVDAETGTVEVVLGEGLAGGFPELAGVPLEVYTAREGDWVVASTLCERS